MTFLKKKDLWKVPLKPPEKLVLMRLADFCDIHGRKVYPDIQDIAADSGLCVRTVELALDKFEKLGWIVKVSPAKQAEYRINLEKIEGLK